MSKDAILFLKMPHKLLGLDKENPKLTIKSIKNINEETARNFFQYLRWESLSEQICPHCQKKHQAYYIKTRKQWRCKYCKHTFSLSSGTIFHSRKLSFVDIYHLLLYFNNRKCAISIYQLSIDLGICYKTAFMNVKKIQHTFLKEQESILLQGEVHIDGKYKTKSIRKCNSQQANAINKDKNKLDKQKNKFSIINATCKYKDEKQPNKWVKKSIVYIAKTEDKETVLKILNQVDKNSKIHTDSAPVYSIIKQQGFNHQKVNHAKEFCTQNGVSNNLAENFNSLLVHNLNIVKHISQKYIFLFSLETAYRRNHSQDSLIQKLIHLSTLCFNHPPIKLI